MREDNTYWLPGAPSGAPMTTCETLDLDQSQLDQRVTLRAQLALIVEHHVPTQLEHSYRDLGRHRMLAESTNRRLMSAAEIEELTDAFLVSAPGAFIEVLERQGLSKLTFAEFYRGIIQPVSRALGEMWCEDRTGFLAVSIATERLRLAVDTLYPDLEIVTRHATRRALVTCYEDSQHNFGAFLLTKAFVFADWLVETRDWNDAAGSPIGLVTRGSYDFVGISIGATGSAQSIQKSITALRNRSMNRNLVIGIGGPGPAMDPAGFARCGQDFISTDAVDAVARAEECVNAA
jgi:methanogenic corrinoid protein MtbC1